MVRRLANRFGRPLLPIFRFCLWAGVTVSFGIILLVRRGRVFHTELTTLDSTLVLIWVGLVCLPLLSEFKVAGLEAKSALLALEAKQEEHFKTLQQHFDVRLSSMWMNVNRINIAVPPAAALVQQRDELAGQTMDKLEQKRSGDSLGSKQPIGQLLTDANRRITQELFRLAGSATTNDAPPAPEAVIAQLVSTNVLAPVTAEAAKSVLAITRSYFIGKEPNDDQVEFVKDVAPVVLDALEGSSPIPAGLA